MRTARRICASGDGVRTKAELLFLGSKANGSRAADFDPKEVPTNLKVTFAPRATSTAECNESMKERKFSVTQLRSFAVGCSLQLVDQDTGHLNTTRVEKWSHVEENPFAYRGTSQVRAKSRTPCGTTRSNPRVSNRPT